MVERAVALGRATEEVQAWDLCGFSSCPLLGGTVQQSCGFCREGLSVRGSTGPADSLSAAREEFERQYILGVLERVRGDRNEAAKLLGLSRKGLSEKCRRYGLPESGEGDQ